jgi:hypothetical protein
VFSDDSLVITRSCTITTLRLLMIQSLTDLTQMLTDAHSASLQIAYRLLTDLLSLTKDCSVICLISVFLLRI